MTSYEVRESNVHGKGVFATRNIREGEVIGQPLRVDYLVVVHITDDLGKWINHSWRANSKLRKQSDKPVWDLVATEAIKKDDEINMDYRETPWFIAKPSIWYK